MNNNPTKYNFPGAGRSGPPSWSAPKTPSNPTSPKK